MAIPIRPTALLALLLLIVAPLVAHAQGSDDETRVRNVAASWEKNWNGHDMKGLAGLFTEDADFVNVAGHHWKGRTEIEAKHAERLAQFKDSQWTTNKVSVQFLQPDLALVHVEWGMRGDTDPDGSPRPPRTGVFTWLVVRQEGAWLIRAAQNTNVNFPAIVSK